MIGAVVHQLWQSVLAWTELKDDEVLFLEGAEDFDVVNASLSTTVQIKDSIRPITLRSKDVIDAITHYWRLRTLEPNKKIQFRFITRASTGVELGNPFGKNCAGLILWRKAANGRKNVRQLAYFLAKLTTLPKDLRAFLRKASDDEIVAQLLKPIHWDTQGSTTEVVEEVVKQRLAAMGESYGVPYDDAIAVRTDLYAEVSSTASKKDHRILDLADLARLFQKAAMVTMPRAEANALRQALPAVQALLSQLSSQIHSEFKMSEQREAWIPIPPKPQHIAPRPEFISDCRKRLSTTLFLVLVGSTGMGKTTAAKLIVQNETESWVWVSCTDIQGQALRVRFEQIAQEIAAGRLRKSIVIDDISLRVPDTKHYEETLAIIAFESRRRGFSLILTSQREPPPSFFEKFDFSPDQAAITIPPLMEAEIDTLAKDLGCTANGLAQRWSKICHLYSSGHPQLALAYLQDLQRRGWPPPELETIQKSSSAIADAKSQWRQLLTTLPETTRGMLYRVALIRGPFRRDHALHLGGANPAIAHPGEEMDFLIGPWIEAISPDYFRVSCLIEEVSEEIWPPEETRRVRLSIVKAMLHCEPRTVLEAGNAFRQAWKANAITELTYLAANFIYSSKTSIFSALALNINWFAFEGFPYEKPLLANGVTTNRLLRQLQFRIASETAPVIAEQILSALHGEQFGENSHATPAENFLTAVLILSTVNVAVTPSRLVFYIEELLKAEASDPKIASLAKLRPKQGDVFAEYSDLIDVFVCSLHVRAQRVGFLSALLDALESAPEVVRIRFAESWRSSPLQTRLLVDAAWLHEAKQRQPDWSRCLALLERSYQLAKTWNALPLAVAALRAIAIIYDEHLHKGEEALAILESREDEIIDERDILKDERATILFHQGRMGSALDLWREVLQKQPKSESFESSIWSYTARTAAIAAGRESLWAESASLFLEAEDRLLRNENPEYRAGLWADAGHSFWRAGDRRRSYELFLRALQAADVLEKGKSNLLAFQTRKSIGHIIMWIECKTIGTHISKSLTPPFPGMASQIEAFPSFAQLPDNDSLLIWVFLSRLEMAWGLGHSLFDKINSRLTEDAFPGTSSFLIFAEIERQFFLRSFTPLPHLVVKAREVMARELDRNPNISAVEKASFQITKDVDSKDMLTGAMLFVAAMIVEAREPSRIHHLISEWLNQCVGQSRLRDLEGWLEFARSLFEAPLEESVQYMESGNGGWLKQIVAAIRINCVGEVAPPLLVQAQCCILDLFHRNPWLRCCGTGMSEIFSRSWRQMLSHRALFSAPNVTIPNLERLCRATPECAMKAATIVLAAVDATGARLPQSLRTQFTELAQGSAEIGEFLAH